MDVIESKNTKKIPVPDELPGRIMESTEVCGQHLIKREKGNSIHHLAKPASLFLFLKAESPQASLIQNYTKQIPTLCINLGWSKRTFDKHLGTLIKMDLVTRDNGRLRIATWKKFGEVFNIDTKKRTTINFTCDGKQKIHWWFAALEIQENQSLQSYMIQKKVNKNSEAKNTLITAMVSRGADPEKMQEPQYFAARLFSLYIEDFRTGTEVHDLLIHIRSDVNRSVKKLANDWCISPQLVSYWKKQMQAQRIIDIAKLQVVSQWSRETNNCHKNPYCHVIWNDKIKERIWFLCDQISVLMPGKWEEFLEQNREAA